MVSRHLASTSAENPAALHSICGRVIETNITATACGWRNVCMKCDVTDEQEPRCWIESSDLLAPHDSEIDGAWRRQWGLVAGLALPTGLLHDAPAYYYLNPVKAVHGSW